MSSEENPSSLQKSGAVPESPGESTEAIANPSDSREVGSLLESMHTLPSVAQGEIVQGKVLKVTESEVVIDVGLKSEAAVPRGEFQANDGRLAVAPGDLVDVCIDHYDETAGTISVSHEKAVRRKVWENVERAYVEQKTLSGRVVDRIKGGLTVDIGILAFLPGSHADTRPHSNLGTLKGQEIVCKVIKLNKRRNNAVVSRKLALEEESNRRKAQLLERLVEGAEIVGRVKNLTDYGVFVDLGGMDGLLHITDLSWGRVSHPSEVVHVGDEIKIKVLKYDREKERVSLGLKQLSPDPWERIPSAYHPGDRVTGRVVSLADYGAFVELEPGIEGLIHISEMTWRKRLRHPSKILNLGDRVEVAVLDANRDQRRVSLSLKQTQPDPWLTAGERFTVGSVVQGRVRNLTDFGAFVELVEGVDGLIHISNLSWDKNLKHPSEVLRKGQKVQAAVLGLDTAHRRLSLGLKQLQADIWEEFFSKTHVGDIMRGKVSRKTSFGVFVELQKGIEGLCHISEFGEGHGGRNSAHVEVGGELDFHIIRLNPSEKKIGLSLKDVARPSAPPEAEKNKDPESPSTMAEALSAAGVTSAQPVPSSPAAEAQPETEEPESAATMAEAFSAAGVTTGQPIPSASTAQAQPETKLCGGDSQS